MGRGRRGRGDPGRSPHAVAETALAWVVVGVPYMLGRAVRRRWHARHDGTPQAAAALAPVERRD
jgi:hypothetical protein